MSEKIVAVVGATGAVGQEMIKTLEQRNFPVKELYLFASERSKGKKLKFKGVDIEVLELKEDVFKKYRIEIALFSAGADTSKKFSPIAAKDGTIVIDNSSAFRMDDNVPLVIPEVNPEDVKWHKGIIANPNCSTIQMLVALKPIYDYSRIKRIIVSTYQAVSGAGGMAIQELEDEIKTYSTLGRDGILNYKPTKFPYPIFMNVIPRIDVVLDNLYTKEEMKIVNETRKMLHDNEIKISATTVRVPVVKGHSEAVWIETEKKVTSEKARELLSNAKGVKLMDDPFKDVYPTPIFNGHDTDDVYVGRIREDISTENGLVMWIVADNLRKGAALNAVQIAEIL
ncbi:MAG: aspartate-semialdehyde dehydrogenase [Spirochaetia bacterium]|nr:aspartate-semialdehyde dehydrogenase [Spirochaetota bacterium]MCX8096597.1 aspartate-semialdehyde dehydrogenase [Spirochaetota bacterium]MDW8112044.1 aspartate-semialdehyde dehydrogenase [Spirochaetia bacterium]